MSITYYEFKTYIDQYIIEKKKVALEGQSPASIKKKDLEMELEQLAERFSIVHQKDSNPTKTEYVFLIENQAVHLELFYRYSNYYTRHVMTPQINYVR